MAVLATVAQLDPDSKKTLIAGAIGFLNSAPIAALGAALALNVQWNLEHLAFAKERILVDYKYFESQRVPVYKNRYFFRRLSTKETSELSDPNTTPLSPPIMSMATRLADAGADTAEAALALAQSQLETTKSRGLIGNIQSLIFGE